jgi:hypothetical protein
VQPPSLRPAARGHWVSSVQQNSRILPTTRCSCSEMDLISNPTVDSETTRSQSQVMSTLRPWFLRYSWSITKGQAYSTVSSTLVYRIFPKDRSTPRWLWGESRAHFYTWCVLLTSLVVSTRTYILISRVEACVSFTLYTAE